MIKPREDPEKTSELLSLLDLNLYSLTAFTAGGRSEAEIATPTRDPMLSPRIAIATAAPDGNAVNIPTIKACIVQRLSISAVTPLLSPYSSSIPISIKPKTNPTEVAKQIPIISFFIPIFVSLLSLMTVPKIAAMIGPINGEINILDAKKIVLSSIRPNAARILWIFLG